MKPFCLPPAEADKFKKAILDGDIDPAKLAAMTSAERQAFFSNRFGEGLAGPMNRLLEEKLLLKNQQAGMVVWAKKMMAHDIPKQNDIVSKIQKMKKLLDPSEESGFLEELVAEKLGTRVTREEAKTISDLVSAVEETKEAFDNGTGDRLDWGRAVIELRNYVETLKYEAKKLRVSDFKNAPLPSLTRAAHLVADNAKSINASMDNSALLRQGLKVLFTHPSIWARNARQSFVDLVKAFGSDQVMNEVNADIVSRPTYGLMRVADLAVGIDEEMFPSSLPEKIPGIGRAYRSTEHAFSAFQRRTRADVFDKYIQIAKDSGVELNVPELQSIGKLVNSLTGRGELGKFEKSHGALNTVFFAPRLVKAHIDTLLLHPTGYGMSDFARKQAAVNLLKIIVGIGAILAIARALKPDSVDWDPRSADFGKIKIKNTRFDVTGGMSSLVTLAARLITGKSKSSTTGKMTELGGRYNRGTVIMDYAGNKLAPAPAVARDLLRGKTFEGETPTVENEAENLLLPIPVKTYLELKKDPNSANMIAALIADALGVSTNTYGKK